MQMGMKQYNIIRALLSTKAHLHPPTQLAPQCSHPEASVYLSQNVSQCRVLSLSPYHTAYELCGLRQNFQPFKSSFLIYKFKDTYSLFSAQWISSSRKNGGSQTDISFCLSQWFQNGLFIGIPRSTLKNPDAWSPSQRFQFNCSWGYVVPTHLWF